MMPVLLAGISWIVQVELVPVEVTPVETVDQLEASGVIDPVETTGGNGITIGSGIRIPVFVPIDPV